MTWWRDHALLDDVSEYIEDGKVTNELKLVGLQRDDLHSILTCQATNNNISVPASTSVKLDMHCKYKIGWWSCKFLGFWVRWLKTFHCCGSWYLFLSVVVEKRERGRKIKWQLFATTFLDTVEKRVREEEEAAAVLFTIVFQVLEIGS